MTRGSLLFTMCALLVVFGFVGRVDAGTTTEVIGTFPGDTATMPQAINDRGMVVGWSDDASDVRRAFSWANGEFLEIPLTSAFAEAWDVNGAGLVVGRYQYAGFMQAFLWDGTFTYNLSILGGWKSSEAFKINGAGQVIGKYSLPSNDSRGYGFLFDTVAWTVSSLDMPAGATLVSPSDINEAGQVVGRVLFPDGTSKAFSWSQAGGMLILPSLGGTYDSAVDVNNLGDIAGTSNGRAVLWTNGGGTISDIGDVAPLPNSAPRLNDRGDVVLASMADPDNMQLYFLPGSGAVVEPLGTLGGRYSNYGALDESGNVCGTSENPQKKYHAFFRAPGAAMIDLTPDSPHVSGAGAMNDVGQVAGWKIGKGKYNLPVMIWSTTP